MKRVLTFLFVFSALALQAQNVRLGFKPVAGENYTVSTEMDQVMNISVPGMGDMTTNIKQALGATITLVEEQEAGYLMEGKLTKLLYSAEAQGQSQSFSSEGEDVTSQAIRTLLNNPFRFVVSKQGDVTEMLPVDELFYAQMDTVLATQYAKRKRETLVTQLKTMFGEQSMKAAVQAGLTKFPDKEMKVPSVWSDDEASKELRANITSQFRLLDITDNVANLSCKVVIMGDPNAEKPEGPQRMDNLYGNGVATFKVDATTGWVIEGSSTQDMKGDLVIEQGGQSQSIPLTLKMTTTVTNK